MKSKKPAVKQLEAVKPQTGKLQTEISLNNKTDSMLVYVTVTYKKLKKQESPGRTATATFL